VGRTGILPLLPAFTALQQRYTNRIAPWRVRIAALIKLTTMPSIARN
jgi:hypothetical protein